MVVIMVINFFICPVKCQNLLVLNTHFIMNTCISVNPVSRK